MPFVNNPQPDVHTWRPDEEFDQAVDRLRVETLWGDILVLAWSTEEASTGGLILARDVMPANIRNHFDGTLDLFEYEPGKTVQPDLFVTQLPDNRLRFELAHPTYEGYFSTSAQVDRIRATQRRIRSSDYIAGTEGQIRSRRQVVMGA